MEIYYSGVHAATKWLPFDGSQNSIFRLSFKLNLSLNVFSIKVKYVFTTLLLYFTSYKLWKSRKIAEKLNLFKLNHITNALIGYLKQVEMSIWKIFPSAPTMGANTDVTIYVKTQSLPKNGSHQKWLHEALHSSEIFQQNVIISTKYSSCVIWKNLSKKSLDCRFSNFCSILL